MDQVVEKSTPQELPERKMIPDNARVEILKLFGEFLTANKVAFTKRTAFIAFLDVVRESLGIGPEWIPEDNAYYFYKPEPQAAQSADAAMKAEEKEGDLASA
jgi:hypothetical protein